MEHPFSGNAGAQRQHFLKKIEHQDQELRGRFQTRRLPGHMARCASGRVE
jgi:hypothetical protein